MAQGLIVTLVRGGGYKAVLPSQGSFQKTLVMGYTVVDSGVRGGGCKVVLPSQGSFHDTLVMGYAVAGSSVHVCRYETQLYIRYI